MNRIIKYTCKELLNETSKTNQKMIRHILTRLNDVSDVRCVPHDCDKVRLSKLHKHYSIILSMSKMFLLNKTSTYNVDRSDSFCFLFPTEMLFEGFIGGYMQSVLGSRAKVLLQASDTTLIEDTIIDDTSYGSAFTLRNDIYVKSISGKCFVLDTKYKQVDRIENTRESALAVQRQVDMDDLRQIREYAFKRGLTEGYLLYPIYRHEDLLLPQKAQLKGYIVVNDEKHYIDVFVIRVPFVFEEDETATHEALARVIERILT